MQIGDTAECNSALRELRLRRAVSIRGFNDSFQGHRSEHVPEQEAGKTQRRENRKLAEREEGFAPVPAIHDVANRAFVFKAQRAWHGGKAPRTEPLCQ